MTKNLNKFSSRVTQPKSQGASQAMLYGTGLSEADMDKPQVGIATVWYEGKTATESPSTLNRIGWTWRSRTAS